MAADVDLESVVQFCNKFEREYLDVIDQAGQKLKGDAGECSSVLGSSGISQTASARLESIAGDFSKAAAIGREEIRKIKKAAEDEIRVIERTKQMLERER